MEFSPDIDLVQEINDHTTSWRQGDIVELGAISWFALPRLALTSQSAAVNEEELSSIVAQTDRLAIVSQTCDIVRDCQQRPFLLLAPIVELPEPVAGEARSGARPRYIPIPGLGNNSFADLDTVVTSEKSILLGFDPKRGLVNERSQRQFGNSIARVFSRFAFPDDLPRTLNKMVTRIKSKHARDSDEGRVLEAIEEIRLTGSPSWDANEIDVFILFSPATRSEASEVVPDEKWDDFIDSWIDKAEPIGVIRSVDGAMIPLDELTARQYIDSVPLDLDYLSWT